MKRWLIFSLLLCPVVIDAQTPAFVQGYNHPVEQSNSAVPDLFQCHCVKMKLPNPSIAGNAYVIFETWGNTTDTVAVTGVTATSVASVQDAGNGQSVQMWFVPNVSATQPTITLTFSSGTLPGHTGGWVMEFSNIATSTPSDGNCTGNPASTTSVACSSAIVTTADKDLLVQGCTNDNPGNTTSWTAGTSPWALLDADRMSTLDNHCGQWQVQTTHGSITPSLTSGTAGTFVTIAVALKAATSGGSLGAGIKVLQTVGNAVDAGTGRPSPFTIQNPCSAATNLIILKWIGASGDLSSVSGSLSGSFTSAGAGNINGASGTLHIYFKGNASTGPTETLTLTTAAANTIGDQAIIECVQGAATSPIDTGISCGASTLVTNTCQTTGTQGSTGSFNVVALTPSTSNGILSVVTGQASNNSDPTASTPQTAYDPPDENNSTAFFYNPDTTARQFTITGNVGAPNAWASQAAAFKAPAAAAQFPQVFVIRP